MLHQKNYQNMIKKMYKCSCGGRCEDIEGCCMCGSTEFMLDVVDGRERRVCCGCGTTDGSQRPKCICGKQFDFVGYVQE